MGLPNLTLAGGGNFETLGASTSTSLGTALSSGTIVQLTASTNFDYDAIKLDILEIANTTAENTLDLLLGVSGSEQYLIDKLRIPADGYNEIFQSYLLPISVPRGSRIAARSNNVGVTSLVVHGIAGGILAGAGYTQAVSMGVTSNKGVVVDPGATINTLGAWTQIIASTAHNYSAVMAIIGGNTSVDGLSSANDGWLVDIGVGASGSEYALFKQLFCGTCSGIISQSVYPNIFGPFPCSIPAGMRLAVRCQSSGNTSATRKIDVALYGFIQ